MVDVDIDLTKVKRETLTEAFSDKVIHRARFEVQEEQVYILQDTRTAYGNHFEALSRSSDRIYRVYISSPEEGAPEGTIPMGRYCTCANASEQGKAACWHVAGSLIILGY